MQSWAKTSTLTCSLSQLLFLEKHHPQALIIKPPPNISRTELAILESLYEETVKLNPRITIEWARKVKTWVVGWSTTHTLHPSVWSKLSKAPTPTIETFQDNVGPKDQLINETLTAVRGILQWTKFYVKVKDAAYWKYQVWYVYTRNVNCLPLIVSLWFQSLLWMENISCNQTTVTSSKSWFSHAT